MPSAHEHFSEQFYKWEKRGRGWQVFGEPVYPEPPFVPFTIRSMTEIPVVDSGSRPSFLGSLFRKVAVPPSPPKADPEPEAEPEPTPLARDSLVELQVTLPAELDINRDAMERLLGNLHLCREPVAFELLGTHKRVLAQFVASEADAILVRKQLSAYFPGVLFRERTDTLEQAWCDSKDDNIYAVEFGLESEFMLPLATGKLDPFIGIVSALAGLEAGELALFQVLWQPLDGVWAENIVRSVTQADGKPLFVNAPELTSAAESKVAKPLYAVVVRMLIQTATERRFQEIARELAGALCAFENPQGNALIPLHNDDYPLEEHLRDVLQRQSRRTGMILNSDELFGFVHLPSEAVRSPELMRDSGRTKAAPITHPPGLLLGENDHNDEIVPVYISPDQRVRHTHIIGIPGTGKSSLLFNLIRQDIESGAGVGVLDPHGDLVEQILGIIPDDRIKDVVLLDLSDTEFPVGFNILQAHSEDEKALLSSDLVAVLRRFSTSWGDQMDIVLHNAILVFLESKQGGTLVDLRNFLSGTQAYRERILQTVTDREVVHFWREIFPKLGAGKSIGSVLIRLQNFFSRKPLRNMVSQRDNKLDFADIMDSSKIFLAKLPEGLNGAENVYLLGSLLVSKFQQTAMTRQNQLAADRKDFWLYVDEFDHFISPSMASIITGARKYRLGMTLAHQELHQLQSEPKVASAVNTSVCTRIVLRVGDDDAKKLAERFESFDAKSLKNLEKYHAVARIERDDWDFNLALPKPELPSPQQAAQRTAEVVAASHATYATPRAEVEAAWLAALGIDTPPDSSNTATPPKPDKPKPEPKPTPPPANEQPSPKPAEPAQPAPVAAEELKDAEIPKVTEAPKVVIPEPVPTTSVQAASHEPALPRESGRGLALHKAMQKRIAMAARKAGFDADPEKQLAKGSQKAADVMLRMGEVKIAVEIALPDSGSVNHEFDNVQKCFAADFARVVVVSTERKRLDTIAAAVRGGLDAALAAKVSYHQADEFIAGLPALATEFKTSPLLPGEDKVDGLIVGSNFPSVTDAAKEKSNYRLVAEILRRRPKSKN